MQERSGKNNQPFLLRRSLLCISCTSSPSPWSVKGLSKLANKNHIWIIRKCNIWNICTFWSNSALSTARLSTWRLNSWTCVRGFLDFSGNGIGSLPNWQRPLIFLILALKISIFTDMWCKWSVTYSFRTGWALKFLILVSSSSILRLSSISFCISSSCLTRLSNWKGSGLVHCLGSGFGGICSNSYSLAWFYLP